MLAIMTLESPRPLGRFDFPLDTEQRVQLYDELSKKVVDSMRESPINVAIIEGKDLTRQEARVASSGIRYRVVKDLGYIHTTVLTDPDDQHHQVILFSKRLLKDIIFESLF